MNDKEWDMMKRFIPIAILLVVLLAACSKPPVERQQFNQIQTETLSTERETAELKAERDDLQQQVDERQAETQALADYYRQLQAEGQ